MNPSLRFRGRYALYAVCAGFEFQFRVNTAASHAADDFLVTAVFAFARADNFHRPFHRFRVFGIHAKKITGKYCRFVSAGAGPNFEIDVAVIMRIGRNQRLLQFQLQRFTILLQRGQFFFAHLAHFVITVAGHFRGGNDVISECFVLPKQANDWIQPRIFHPQITKLVLIANYVGIGHQARNLFEPVTCGL